MARKLIDESPGNKELENLESYIVEQLKDIDKYREEYRMEDFIKNLPERAITFIQINAPRRRDLQALYFTAASNYIKGYGLQYKSSADNHLERRLGETLGKLGMRVARLK